MPEPTALPHATSPTGDPTPTLGHATPAPGPAAARIRDLHPGWFASVMGTAILAVAADANPGNVRALADVGHAAAVTLGALAMLLGVVLTVAYAVRWTRFTAAALADLRHPVLGGLHATLPGGLLVLAVMTSVVGPGVLPAGAVTATVSVLAVAGGLLALVVGVAFSYTLFTSEVPAGLVNGGWFIPPVVTVIVPMVLTPLLTHVDTDVARLLLVIGYACLGLGFLQFLLVLGMLHDRLVLYPLPPAQLAPSLFIALGPIGVSILAPLTLARGAQDVFGVTGPTIVTLSQVVGTALWGFGAWWLAIAVALLIRYLRSGPVPFHLGWWAFVFPLGAYTVATVTLARTWQVAALDAFGAILFLALAAAWGTVAVRTVAAVSNGSIWRR